MKKLLLKAMAVVIGLTVFTSYSYSQVQIGLHGSRLEGTGSSQWGFGGNIKFLVADKFAIGVAARGYPKNMKSENFDYGGNNYKMLHGNSIVPVTASLDYYFGKAPVRPYLGLDAGAYFRQHIISITQNNGSSSYYNTSDKKTFLVQLPVQD